jgi:putative membrane protein
VVSTIVNALALLIASWFVPGMAFIETPLGGRSLQTVATAILVGLINLLLRPVVLYIARPLGFFVLFGVGFLLNMVDLLLADWLLPGFELGRLLWTAVASIAIAGVNTFLVQRLDAQSFQRLGRALEVDAAGALWTASRE